MEGFFAPSLLVSKAPRSLVAKCGACKLYLGCNTPKMTPSGKGKRRILVVGEAPSKAEDKSGRHFAGDSGDYFKTVLSSLDVDLRRDLWCTNTLICHPPKKSTPTKKQIDYCHPNLTNYIEQVKPHVIIPMGTAAVRGVIGWLWKEDPGGIGQWVGWNIPCQRLNTWICPTYHPSYILRNTDRRGKKDPVLELMFKQHIERAVELSEGRPWETVPDYQSQVERIYDGDDVDRIIDKMIAKGGRVAFDYETNCLKPDGDPARIVCCSVCYEGKKTIAYPWTKQTRNATKRLVQSELEKFGSNIKFEERWSMAKLKTPVNNWKWCTMNGAHVLDNRRKITSIKFQSFVRLGQESYNDHIEPYLQAKGGNKKNKIHLIDMDDLLLYCGMDSLLEYLVAIDQLKELKKWNRPARRG